MGAARHGVPTTARKSSESPGRGAIARYHGDERSCFVSVTRGSESGAFPRRLSRPRWVHIHTVELREVRLEFRARIESGGSVKTTRGPVRTTRDMSGRAFVRLPLTARWSDDDIIFVPHE